MTSITAVAGHNKKPTMVERLYTESHKSKACRQSPGSPTNNPPAQPSLLDLDLDPGALKPLSPPPFKRHAHPPHATHTNVMETPSHLGVDCAEASGSTTLLVRKHASPNLRSDYRGAPPASFGSSAVALLGLSESALDPDHVGADTEHKMMDVTLLDDDFPSVFGRGSARVPDDQVDEGCNVRVDEKVVSKSRKSAMGREGEGSVPGLKSPF